MRFESTIRRTRGGRVTLAFAATCLVLLVQSQARALQWAGRSWNVTNGGMAGGAQGSPSNVSVDANGYLHLLITKNGNTWTAAELFTTDKLGFGTYQWQIDAPLDRFDKNVVLGLYPYGPAAGIGQDGNNEIDIEYSFWGNDQGVNGDWTDYPASGTTIGEKSYQFSLNGGTFSTSRFIWSTNQIENFLLTGFQAVGSTSGLVNSWTYAPSNSKVNIPQQALPLGINLWCFQQPPSDGKNVEAVIRSFQFVPAGTDPGGGGGASAGGASAGGASAGGASAGGASAGGASAGGASAGGASAGGASAGGASGSAGSTPTAGASSVGGTSNGGSGGTAAHAGTTGGADAGASGATSAAGGTLAAGGVSASAGTSGAATAPGAGAASTGAGTATDTSDQASGCSVATAGDRAGRASLWFALPLLVLGRRRRRQPARVTGS